MATNQGGKEWCCKMATKMPTKFGAGKWSGGEATRDGNEKW